MDINMQVKIITQAQLWGWIYLFMKRLNNGEKASICAQDKPAIGSLQNQIFSNHQNLPRSKSNSKSKLEIYISKLI